MTSEPAVTEEAFYLRAFLASEAEASADDERRCLELMVSMRIGFLARAWIDRAKALFRGRGYTADQRAHLCVLAAKPAGLTQTELAQALHLSEASLSRRIRLSIEEGLVSRHALQGDGRAHLIRLEAKGLSALRASDQVAREDRVQIFSGVTDEELAITAKVLKLLTDRMTREVESPAET